MNGVCVIWKGWIDLQRLDGSGYLDFDEERAQVSCRGEFFALVMLRAIQRAGNGFRGLVFSYKCICKR